MLKGEKVVKGGVLDHDAAASMRVLAGK